jgi:hypothetical protein
MRIPSKAQRCRVNKVHVSRDERRENRLGFSAGEFGEQFVVVQFKHLPNDVRKRRNWTKNFSDPAADDARTLWRI